MINFIVPEKIGIGLSRGSACCLISGDKILDYSGRCLNLASRLMNLARPSGIVFDENFNHKLLSPKLKKIFAKESVFIKGIAEQEPLEIYYTKNYTKISPINKKPLEKIRWITKEIKLTMKKLRDYSPRYLHYLEKEPLDQKEIKMSINYPTIVRGRKHKTLRTQQDVYNFKYFLEAGKPALSIDIDSLVEELELMDVKDNWGMVIKIIYPEK